MPIEPNRPVITAVDLEAMTPAERHESFQKSLIMDFDRAPSDLVERARARTQEHIDRIARNNA